MKNFLKLAIALLFVQLSVYGQNTANPFINLNMSPATLALNTNGIVEIDAGNAGQEDIARNSLRVLFSMSSNGEILGLDPSSDPKWTIFSLTTGTGNSVVLRNTLGPIPLFSSSTIKLIVKATASGGPNNMAGNISYYFISGGNLLLANPPYIPGTQSSAQGNDPNDDNGSSSLTVATVLAVSLTTITSTASDCSATIKWNTVKEDAGSTFDVEYSPDGARFVKVGTVAGRSATGAKYEYSYSQGSGKGYYRLKIGTRSGGSISYSKVVNITTICNEKKAFIYPNPIKNQQDLHVNIANFTGTVKGDLVNAAGQIILTKRLVNGANNLVKIENLPHGVYTFKVIDEAKEIQNFKVVIVK